MPDIPRLEPVTGDWYISIQVNGQACPFDRISPNGSIDELAGIFRASIQTVRADKLWNGLSIILSPGPDTLAYCRKHRPDFGVNHATN